MGRVGYSSITVTDLTETIPVNLLLETNKEENIQVKIGSLYQPDFSKNEEELIITPSLFLGQQELINGEDYNFVMPNGRTDGYIFYQNGDLDSNGLEKKYYYGSSSIIDGIWVDEFGRLHYKKNLTRNIMIEAYIENFINKDHNYTIPLIKATNPINFLLLDGTEGNYSVIISAKDSKNKDITRQHFEDRDANPITLTAILYNGTEQITLDKNNDYVCNWYKLTDATNNPWQSGVSSCEITRADVFSEEKIKCEILDKKTNLTYFSTIDIWDLKEDYDCQIIKNLEVYSESTEKLIFSANVYDSQGILINPKDDSSGEKKGYSLTYQWGYINSNGEPELLVKKEDDDGISLEGNTLALDLKNFTLNKQNFTFYCNIFNNNNDNNDNNGKRIVSEIETISFVTERFEKISPSNIFVKTKEDGTYNGNENYIYTFNFQLIDKEGNPIHYDTLDEILESIDGTVSYNDGTSINFSRTDSNNDKWDFTGTITFNLEDENNLWNAKNEDSRYYEFSYVYGGYTYSTGITIVKNVEGAQGAQGAQGFSGYTVDLSNEFHAFAGGEGQADADQSTECLVSAYYGSDALDIVKITLGTPDDTIYSSSASNSFINYKGKNLFVSASASTGKEVKITIRTNISTSEKEKDSFLRDIIPLPLLVTIKDKNNVEVTFVKTFTYTINYNGKSYRLIPSANTIVYNEIQKTFTPNQITVSATARQTTGEAIAYSEGKILYSLDETNKNWKIYSNKISGFNGITNIYLRLYGKNANFSNPPTNDEITDAAKYLLDIETIPIITSTEGYQIGGENLLRWTKDLPIENNKWSRNDNSNSYLTIEKDGDFSVLNYNVKEDDVEWKNFKSPRTTLESEYIGKDFCFSCFVYSDNWDSMKESTFNLGISAYKDIFSVGRDAYKNVGLFNHQGESSSNPIHYEGTWDARKWIKIWTTFSFDNLTSTDFDTNGDGKKNQDDVVPSFPHPDYKYFSFDLFLHKKGQLKIKKPKLEIGNVPTDWSASPYDISSLDIAGANLGDTTQGIYYRITNTDSPKIFAGGLPAGTYTFSFGSSSWSGPSTISTFLCKLFKKSGTEELAISGGEFSFSNNTTLANQKTFTIKDSDLGNDELAFLRIYANSSASTLTSSATLTLKSAKLEKGFLATSFTLEGEYLENYLNVLSKADIDQNQLINIYTNEGKIVSTVNGLSETISTLSSSYVTIDSFKGRLEAASEEVYNLSSSLAELGTLKNAVKVVTKNSEGGPYIQIQQVDSNDTGTSFSAIRITNDQLGFYSADPSKSEPVAYINSSKLSINSAEFINSFTIGDLEVSITESGVGFRWP